jgi:hypothetical protein
VQDNTEEGRVDVETAIVVLNEAEFPEFIHEKIHPRPRCANHFRQQVAADQERLRQSSESVAKKPA